MMPRIVILILIITAAHAEDDEDVMWRIAGGRKADPHQFAYLVSVNKDGHHICGGSLLLVKEGVNKSDIVLTAAHCVTGFLIEGGNFSVVLGEHNIALKEDDEIAIKVHSSHAHEQFGGYGDEEGNVDIDAWMKNDIAILKLEHTVDFNEYIQPIRLPADASEEPPLKTPLQVAGWGDSEEGPEILHWAEVPMVSMDVCVEEYKNYADDTGYPYALFPDTQLCAGNGEGGTCQGDSGGPLVGSVHGQATQFGVVSWAKECDDDIVPGIYTRLSAYRDWINDKIKQLTSL